MMIRSNGKTKILIGENLRDVAAFLRNNPPVWSCSATGSRQLGAGTSWDLGVGYEGAWRLADEGWSQGAADLQTAVNAIEPDQVLPELKWDFGGERVDVPRYLGGSPDCMVRKGANHRQRRVVHLVVNGTVSASVSAKTIAAYGAALTAVVDTIENSGRRVEIDIVYAISNLGQYDGDKRCIVGWKVKEAGDHCDMAAIAFSIAHPAAFRRIGFALMERLPRDYQNSGYGMCAKVRPDDLAALEMAGAFILPGVGESNFGVDVKDALPRAISQINEIAGEEIVRAA